MTHWKWDDGKRFSSDGRFILMRSSNGAGVLGEDGRPIARGRRVADDGKRLPAMDVVEQCVTLWKREEVWRRGGSRVTLTGGMRMTGSAFQRWTFHDCCSLIGGGVWGRMGLRRTARRGWRMTGSAWTCKVHAWDRCTFSLCFFVLAFFMIIRKNWRGSGGGEAPDRAGSEGGGSREALGLAKSGRETVLYEEV